MIGTDRIVPGGERVNPKAWIGMLIGVALKIATIFAMLGIFVAAYFI